MKAFTPRRPTFSSTIGGSKRCGASSLLKSAKASEKDGGDANINVALTQLLGENEPLQTLMEKHPLLSLIDKNTTFVEIPCVDATFQETFQLQLESVDVACFGTPESVQQWLDCIDVTLGAESKTDEEKRALGNGNVIAACIGTETARICLESGRWQANDIYYPKGDDDMQGWADSAVQAVADIVEKDFWGDGDASW